MNIGISTGVYVRVYGGVYVGNLRTWVVTQIHAPLGASRHPFEKGSCFFEGGEGPQSSSA